MGMFCLDMLRPDTGYTDQAVHTAMAKEHIGRPGIQWSTHTDTLYKAAKEYTYTGRPGSQGSTLTHILYWAAKRVRIHRQTREPREYTHRHTALY
jgi:hypothetical protein